MLMSLTRRLHTPCGYGLPDRATETPRSRLFGQQYLSEFPHQDRKSPRRCAFSSDLYLQSLAAHQQDGKTDISFDLCCTITGFRSKFRI